MMFSFYLKLAIRNLVRARGVTLLCIVAIALGIAVPTAIISIYHTLAGDPIPSKSDRLFNVRVDSWDPNQEFFDVEPGEPPKHITYRDMTGLLESDLAVHRTGVAAATNVVFPAGENERPYTTIVRLCHADFFPMFDVPFAYGAGWTREIDARREPVTVLSHESNERLFGGADSVGRRVRLGDNELTVVGVLAPWSPMPQFYDVINNAMGSPRQFFVPFDLIRNPEMGFSRTGDSDGWGDPTPPDQPDLFFTASESTWIQYWVEVEPDRVAAYRDHVDAYTQVQKELGRFPRPLNNRVTPLMEWMQIREVAPPVTVALIVIAVLFLLVCALNLTGLLLARFLASSPLIGVHRALGASKASIFVQRLLECELLGVLGGVLGIMLAGVALAVINGAMPAQIIQRNPFQLDLTMLGVAVGLSLLAGLVAGIYPAWRACRIAPAIQLKLQ